MTRPTFDRQAGFALVESIAVLALSGLVMLTLVLATDLVSRNSALATRNANTIETLVTGFAAVRRDLEGARFIRTGAKSGDPILFSGSQQAVAVAVADDGSAATPTEGLVLIEARYEEGRGVLLRSSAPLSPGMKGFGTASFANSVVLLSGPWKYRFSYSDPQATTEHWNGTWTASDRMPGAIRLEVTDDAGNDVVSPLSVKMQIGSGGCADPARLECSADDSTDQSSGDQNQTKDRNQNQGNSGDGANNGQ